MSRAGAAQGRRLHVGCGGVRLDGWINLDLEASGATDLVRDVRDGLPFDDGTLQVVFAEHFIEHLTRDEGAAFLSECHRVLGAGGVIRLSTPNLDWVWRTHYAYPADDDTKRLGASHLNQAFHGWGHRFLYNDVVLADALAATGFEAIGFFAFGESDREDLRGLEKHAPNTFEVSPTLPDVIIAQATKPAAG